MPTTTPNLGLTLPTPNVDTGWGGTLNTDFTAIDNVFAASGSGTSVGINVGSGKTANVGGTLVAGGTVILGSGDGTNTVTAPTIRGAARTGTNVAGPNIQFDAINGTGSGGSGGFLFRTAPAGAAGSTASVFQDSLFIEKSGKVGIGTTTPPELLSVSSSAASAIGIGLYSSSSDPIAGSNIYFNNDVAGYSAIFQASSASSVFSGPNSFNIANSRNAPVSIWTNGSERVRVAGSGAIGLSGANYGTAGQVLTSQGPSAAPVWQNSASAWVVFNGSPVSILASSNVTSVTRNGTGDYTINFTSALPSANYAVSGSAMATGSTGPFVFVDGNTAPTASAVRIQVVSVGWPAGTASTSAVDSSRVSVIVFG